MKIHLPFLILFIYSVGFSQEIRKISSDLFPQTQIPKTLFGEDVTEKTQPDSVVTTPKVSGNFAYEIPKIDFTEKKTYYQLNRNTGQYESFIFYGGEIRKEQTYFSLVEVPQNCFSPKLHGTAGPGDLVGALIQALVDDMDLKFKIGKVNFSFEE